MTDLVVCRFGVAIRNSPFAIRNSRFEIGHSAIHLVHEVQAVEASILQCMYNETRR